MLKLVEMAILLAVILLLLLKIKYMRRSCNEILEGMKNALENDTNTLITISSGDAKMRLLAAGLNKQLKLLRKQRLQFITGDLELKEAVTNISHDLRTPLTAISGYLDLLEHTKKDEQTERYIAVIKNRTELLNQLTEELFQYSVIASAGQELSLEPVVINGVLEESILDFYAALQERNITPTIQITEERLVRNINRSALSRIFANLLNNAVKYSDGDLEIVMTKDGKITFSNRASELSEVQVERLFDRFYTVETARKSTGLGLSITRILIEQMGGSISAKYEDGRLEINCYLGA